MSARILLYLQTTTVLSTSIVRAPGGTASLGPGGAPALQGQESPLPRWIALRDQLVVFKAKGSREEAGDPRSGCVVSGNQCPQRLGFSPCRLPQPSELAAGRPRYGPGTPAIVPLVFAGWLALLVCCYHLAAGTQNVMLIPEWPVSVLSFSNLRSLRLTCVFIICIASGVYYCSTFELCRVGVLMIHRL